MYLCSMNDLYIFLSTFGTCLWIGNIILTYTYFKHPLMWRSKWFWLTLIIPCAFLFWGFGKRVRYELFDIIRKDIERDSLYERFVMVEKSGRVFRPMRRCQVCSEKPTWYSNFNTMDFFVEGSTEIGISCKCGDYCKVFEFGFLHLHYGNYGGFMNNVGSIFVNAIINEWNFSGYRQIKTPRKGKPLKVLIV